MQAKYSKWQNLPRGHPEKKGLQAELEEECQSLEYMVRGATAVAAAGSAHLPWLRRALTGRLCLHCKFPFVRLY